MNKSLSIIGLAALLLGGCAGSATLSGLTDPATNSVQGQAALDTALGLPSTADPTQQLSDAVYKLNTAYSQEPTPTRAAGFAIASTAKLANDLATLFGTEISRGGKTIPNPTVRHIVSLLAPWRSEETYSASFSPVSLLTDSLSSPAESSRAYPDDPTPVQVKTALEATRSDLNRIVSVLSDANIDAISAANFSVIDPKGTGGARTKIGKADLLILRGNAKLICSYLNFVLGYDITFSSSSFDSSKTLAAEFGPDATSGATVVSTRLLPPAPFLGLASEGAANIANAKANLLAASADLGAAATDITSRGASTGSPRWFAEALKLSAADLSNVSNELSGYLTTQTNVTIGGVSTGVTVGDFLTSPSALRGYLPSFTVSSSAGNYTFTPVEGSYDAKFGNLFSTGVRFRPVTLNGSKNRLDLLAEFLNNLQGK
jgi:hypothetical protein